MDLGGAPEWVLKAHSLDQVAHLFGDPRSAPGRTRLPSPVSGETHSVPSQDGLGPDDGYGVKDARAATIEPNEQSTIGQRKCSRRGARCRRTLSCCRSTRIS